MNKIVLSLCLLLPSLVHGQQISKDSIYSILEKSTADTASVHAALQLGNEYNYVNRDSALFYWNLSKNLGYEARSKTSPKSKTDISLVKNIASSLNNIGYTYGKIGDTSTSIKHHFEALHLSEFINDWPGISSAYEHLGGVHSANGKPLEALDYYQLSLANKIKAKDSAGIANIHSNTGVAYERIGDAHAALKEYNEALTIYERIKDYEGIARVYSNLGVIYLQQNEAEKGINYYKLSVDIRDSLGDQRNVAYALANLGAGYGSLNRYEEALLTYEKCLEVAKPFEDPYLNCQILNNIGKAYEKLGDSALAEQYYLEAYNDQIVYNTLIGTIYTRINLANFCFSQNRLQEALVYSTGALESAQLVKNLDGEKQSAEILAKVQEKLGNWEEAFKALKTFTLAKDSLYNTKNQRAAIEQETKYNYQKKIYQDSILQRQATDLNQLKLQQKDAALSQERILTASLIAVVVLVLVLLTLSFFAYQRKKASEQQTQRNLNKIAKQDQEKELLLKEIHHRVKNNLQIITGLLELQSLELNDESFSQAMLEGQNRVKSMALIHEKLYQVDALAKIEMNDYVKNLSNELSAAYQRGQQVQFELVCPELFLDIDTAIPMGLILNELISNSWKYAFSSSSSPNFIRIELASSKDGSFFLSYRDSGPGLPEGFDPKKSKSLGIRLIHRLSKQLFGSVEYKKLDIGCEFFITFHDTEFRKKQA